MGFPTRSKRRSEGPGDRQGPPGEERNAGDSGAPEGPAQGLVPWRYVFAAAPVSSLLATGLGVGLVPGPSGTWGSLATVLACEALYAAGGVVPVAALALLSTLAGPWAAGETARRRGVKDPGEIVIDEVSGQSIALAGLHLVFPGPAAWIGVALAFALFRLLDILKPGPIGALERLPGGLGIMADDVLAGLLVALVFPLARALGIGA